MRPLKTLLLFSILLTSSIGLFAQTQLEMNKEANDKYSLLDQQLNKIYDQILTAYGNDSVFIGKLKISQQTWIKFRDAEVDMLFPAEDKWIYGSMFSMCRLGILTNMTNERINHLEKWLKPTPEGEGCTGSMKYREFINDNGSIEIIDTNPNK